MAKIRFKCACEKVLAVDEQHAGKTIRCPNCQRPVQVPQPANAPSPGDMKDQISELTSAYGTVLKTKARRERLDAALSSYKAKARKRNLIIAGSTAGAIVVGLILFQVFRSHGVDPGRASAYPEEIQDILPGFTDSDPRVRAAATWEAADLAGRSDERTLTQLRAVALQEKSPLVRLVALTALCRVDPENVRVHLEPALSDPNFDVRMRAAFVLAQCSDVKKALSPEALEPHVRKALEGESEWLGWLDEAWQKRADPAGVEEFLVPLLASKDAEDRSVAVWLIAVMLGPHSKLFEAARDPDPSVVASALYALEPYVCSQSFELAMTGPNRDAVLLQLRTALRNVVLRLRDNPENPAVRTAAALTLGSCGQSDETSAFAYALKDPDWFVRFAGYKGLEALDPATAMDVIRTVDKENPPKNNEWIHRVRQRIEKRAAEAKEQEKPDGVEPAEE